MGTILGRKGSASRFYHVLFSHHSIVAVQVTLVFVQHVVLLCNNISELYHCDLCVVLEL
jgi:hypothetical protein